VANAADSQVTEEIAFDLCKHVDLVGRGVIRDEALLGPAEA
jgi:hypothetical protein